MVANVCNDTLLKTKKRFSVFSDGTDKFDKKVLNQKNYTSTAQYLTKLQGENSVILIIMSVKFMNCLQISYFVLMALPMNNQQNTKKKLN